MRLQKNNISIMDVRNCIGYPSTDLGTLCSASRFINKWSKYKPVDNNFTFDRPVDWWKGADRNCGITYTVYNSLDALANAVKNDELIDFYNYQGPKGGSTSPYRLGDFAGYNGDAIPPISYGSIIGEATSALKTILFMCPVSAVTEDSLSVADIFGSGFNGNVYYGVGMRRKGSSDSWLWMTTEQPFTEGSNTAILQFPTSSLRPETTYDVILFLTYNHITYPVNSTCTRCIPLPKLSTHIPYIQTLEYKSKSAIDTPTLYDIHLIPQFSIKEDPFTGESTQDLSKVSYRLSFSGQKNYVLKNVKVILKASGKTDAAAYDTDIIGNLTIPASGKTEIILGFLDNRRVGNNTGLNMWNPSPYIQVWEDGKLRLSSIIMQQMQPQ